MNLRSRVKRLEYAAREEMLEIPQPDGTRRTCPSRPGV
jgi:hypothetical protein